jgi:hypothetical protein
VIEAGQVVGTLSRADLIRLTETLAACPEVLSRDDETGQVFRDSRS